MRWRDTILVPVLVCTGCFSSFPPDTPESGTRLRARMLRPESGEPRFLGWHDSELGEDCAYRRTVDGALRCLPYAPLVRPDQMLFLDATCAIGVAVQSPCWDSAFAHVAEFPCAPTTIHTLGEAVSVVGVFTRDAEGICVPHEGDVREVQLIGDEIPPERFVAAELVPPEDGPERLASGRLVAEDGSGTRIAPYDRVRERFCTYPVFESPGLAEVPCVDSTARTFTGGASCDERWVNLGGPCPDEEPPDLTIEVQFDECSHIASYEIVRVGEPVTDPTRGLACDGGPPPNEPHHTSPAPRDAMAWLHRELRGEGRLRARVWSGDDATIPDLSTRAYYDAELELECGAVSVGEEILCLPDGRHGAGYSHHFPAYAGPGCTVSAVAFHLDRACRVAHIRRRRDAQSGCGTEVDAIYRVGAPLDAVYEERDGACVPMEGVQGHALEPMPFDLFARLEIVVE